MPGILATAAYVPRWRLPREVIAREWGGFPMGGEKAVANHDEDALTMAVNAALSLDGAGGAPDAIWFASTTSPYLEKQSATTIAAVLDLPPTVRTMDVGASLRAGTSALLAAVDAVAGGAQRVLVTAADCRLGEPESSGEQSWGDAAAAVVVGADAGGAEILATRTVSDEFLGTWRTSAQAFPHGLPGGAFETKQGYGRVLVEAARGALVAAKIGPEQLATVIVPTPQPRAPLAIAKALGIDPKRQLQDGLWMQLGDTGAAQPLLLLAAALERAAAGDLILLLGYGDGADAVVLRATGTAVHAGAGVARQIETKRTLPSYGRYARFRRLMRRDPGGTDAASPVIHFRDRRELLPLHGGRCAGCGVVQFPKHRACIECGASDGLDDVRLGRRGTLFTFTHDHVAESPDPPTTHAVVDLDGGGRLYLQLTDCDAEQVALDMPLELTFRRLHEGGGFNNYFWKARPA